jgi:tRNA G18 (ribose-2'-O)-methylase SpoU
MQKRLFINNVRSAHNVGAMFRTADGAGVEHLYIGGYTPIPTDRFGRPQPEIAKTSLGACDTVPWEKLAVVRK